MKKNNKLNSSTLNNLYNEINKMNGTIENLMDRIPDGEGYVVKETTEWFLENECDTLELVTKEYIKWYFTMGGYWLNNATLIVRYHAWGKKVIKDLKALIKNMGL